MDIQLQFPSDFFNEEMRCDYIVSKKQKKIWACELDLANLLISVCQKYNIRIMGFAGTMLGAIRHKGFIPWDDDMDFCMLREDFNRLIEVGKDEFKYPYFLQTALSDREFFFGYARLRNSSTTGIIKNHNKNYNCGIYIDIFVLDGYIDDEKKFSKQIKDRDLAGRMASFFSPYHGNKKSMKQFVKTVTRNIYSTYTNFEEAVDKYNKILSRYNNDTTRVTFMTHPLHQLTKYWIYSSDFSEIDMKPFESIYIPISNNYKRILTNTYGDYMTYPPVQERGIWHNDQIYFDPDISYSDFFESNINN